MTPDQEKRMPLQSPYERLTEQFSKMTSVDENGIVTSEMLPDRTSVSMGRGSDLLEYGHNPFSIKKHYWIEIKPLSTSDTKEDEGLFFSVQEDNSLHSISVPTTESKVNTAIVNDIKVPIYRMKNDVYREGIYHVSRFLDRVPATLAANFLTGWLCEVREKGRYISPKISFSS